MSLDRVSLLILIPADSSFSYLSLLLTLPLEIWGQKLLCKQRRWFGVHLLPCLFVSSDNSVSWLLTQLIIIVCVGQISGVQSVLIGNHLNFTSLYTQYLLDTYWVPGIFQTLENEARLEKHLIERGERKRER